MKSALATAEKPSHVSTRNACKLCAPLGASLVFKGIDGAVPLLHGSQGCSTYIRRYLISHFKEPVDIACTNFAEETAIFGGGANLKVALENLRTQYDPSLIGIATTCLSETIGDDVPLFLREYRSMCEGADLPPLVHVSTPSYRGTHIQGFHAAVKAVVETLAADDGPGGGVNLFPGMVSPADLRHLKDILDSFGLTGTVLPDYSQTLDGCLWTEYQRIPEGGTPVKRIREAGSARATLELGRALALESGTAGTFLEKRFAVPCHRLGLPMGVEETDRFFAALEDVSGRPVPYRHREVRGRLLDALVDGHKYVRGVRAALYGETDLVAGLAAFLGEIGMEPVLCATGETGGRLKSLIPEILPPGSAPEILENADFVDVEYALEQLAPDLIIGSGKGYTMSRRLGVPLVRVGFPIHDRFGGARLLHLGYEGALRLFDQLVNTVMEQRQASSDWGYTYM